LKMFTRRTKKCLQRKKALFNRFEFIQG